MVEVATGVDLEAAATFLVDFFSEPLVDFFSEPLAAFCSGLAIVAELVAAEDSVFVLLAEEKLLLKSQEGGADISDDQKQVHKSRAWGRSYRLASQAAGDFKIFTCEKSEVRYLPRYRYFFSFFYRFSPLKLDKLTLTFFVHHWALV